MIPNKAWLVLFLSIQATASELDNDLQLEVIEVTAQKRQQFLEDVPLAVSAYDSNSLKQTGISSITDLSLAAPSFVITPIQNKVANSPARIRGIGTLGTDPAFEGAVGFYVDGIYRSRSAMVLSTLHDIEMLQVLRGPQGTLFGKNNSAGALIFDSTKPTDSFAAGTSVSVGNYQQRKVSAYINSPVSDSLSIRVSVLHDERDGFIHNPWTGTNPNNVDTDSIKLQGLYSKGDTEIRVIADYTRSDQLCCLAIFGRVDPEADAQADVSGFDSLYSTYTNGAPYYDVTGDVFSRQIVNQTDAKDTTEDWGLSLDLDHVLNENLTLGYLASYRQFDNEQKNGDWDVGPIDLGRDNRELYEFTSISQELTLTGVVNIANVETNFVAGLFYFKEDLEHFIQRGTSEFFGENFQYLFALNPDSAALAAFPADQLAKPDTFFNQTAFAQEDEVAAAYGHFTFNITDNIAIVAGLRYSEESKTLNRQNLLADSPLDMFNYMAQNQLGMLALGATYNGPDAHFAIDEDELTYTLGFQYFWQNSQLYGRYARGYKAGGISLNNDAGGNLVSINNLFLPPTTVEEVVISPTNDPTYDPEYVDTYELGVKSLYQEGRGRLNLALFRSEYKDIQSNTFTGAELLTYNADTALTQGIELENTYVLTDSLTNTIAITWLKDAKFGDEPNAFQPLLQGRDLELAPELSAFFNLNYEADWYADKAVFADLNLTYKSDHSLSNDRDYRQSYSTVGARVGIKVSDTTTLSLSCNNCLDKDYLQQIYPVAFQFHNPLMGIAAPPRTWKLTLEYEWQ